MVVQRIRGQYSALMAIAEVLLSQMVASLVALWAVLPTSLIKNESFLPLFLCSWLAVSSWGVYRVHRGIADDLIEGAGKAALLLVSYLLAFTPSILGSGFLYYIHAWSVVGWR